MIKKMYTSKNQFKTLVKNPKRRILVLSKDKLSTKEKEIIITDEDLFKNVRKLMDDNLDYNYNPVDLESAILKDIANFDNLPASGESLTGELGIVKTKKERL